MHRCHVESSIHPKERWSRFRKSAGYIIAIAERLEPSKPLIRVDLPRLKTRAPSKSGDLHAKTNNVPQAFVITGGVGISQIFNRRGGFRLDGIFRNDRQP